MTSWHGPGPLTSSYGWRQGENHSMNVKVIGLDTAKHACELYKADASVHAVLKKWLRESQLTNFFGLIRQ